MYCDIYISFYFSTNAKQSTKRQNIISDLRIMTCCKGTTNTIYPLEEMDTPKMKGQIFMYGNHSEVEEPSMEKSPSQN